MITLTGKYNKAKIMIDEVDNATISQITEFINHPAFEGDEIAIMADCHCGRGSVIGFTMPLTGHSVGPAIVGCDIGCAVLSINIGHPVINYEELHKIIESKIPHGMNIHDEPIINMDKEFPWKEIKITAQHFAQAWERKFNEKIYEFIPNYSPRWFEKKCDQIRMNIGKAKKSLGTLGGGRMIASRPSKIN